MAEPQVLVDDFVSATYSRMTFKSDPFIQAILDIGPQTKKWKPAAAF